MLNVWVVHDGICDHVMGIVVVLPPLKTDALQEMPYKYRDEIVLLRTVCDHVMTQIVPNERQLLPEHSDTHSPRSDPEFAVGVGETEETGEKERHNNETTTKIQVRIALKSSLLSEIFHDVIDILGKSTLF